MRNSRDGDYRILQAVTQDPECRVELAKALVGPVADFPEACIGIVYEAMHDRGILSCLDSEIPELPEQNRRIPEHRGGRPENLRDFLAGAL